MNQYQTFEHKIMGKLSNIENMLALALGSKKQGGKPGRNGVFFILCIRPCHFLIGYVPS
jgi:hypothetical protein